MFGTRTITTDKRASAPSYSMETPQQDTAARERNCMSRHETWPGSSGADESTSTGNNPTANTANIDLQSDEAVDNMSCLLFFAVPRRASPSTSNTTDKTNTINKTDKNSLYIQPSKPTSDSCNNGDRNRNHKHEGAKKPPSTLSTDMTRCSN